MKLDMLSEQGSETVFTHTDTRRSLYLHMISTGNRKLFRANISTKEIISDIPTGVSSLRLSVQTIIYIVQYTNLCRKDDKIQLSIL